MHRIAQRDSPRWRAATASLAAVAVGAGVMAASTLAPTAQANEAEASVQVDRVPRTGDPLDAFYGQTLRWSTCEFGEAECARLRVPVDYSDPSGSTITLSVQRVRAADTPRGSLVINPGGPGAPGADWARYAALGLDPAVVRSYDLVGFDPRGVGGSNPLLCFTARSYERANALTPKPDTAAERRAYQTSTEAFVRDCRTSQPILWRHVGTRNVARDLDVLRAALGDDRLNFLGFSYGTRIGAVYADMFPDRVGRFVLDGALNPALSSSALGRGQARGFDRAIRRFAEWCAEGPNCPLGDTAKAAIGRLNATFARIDREPVRSGREVLDLSTLLSAVMGSMYSPSLGWPRLREALTDAFAGDVSGLIAVADSFRDAGEGPRAAMSAQSGLIAVNCTDTGPGPSFGDAVRRGRIDARSMTFPVLGHWGALASTSCRAWPAVDRLGPVRGPSDTPILIIGTRFDPATPYAWSVQLADQLRSGRLLTVEADGHTATFTSRCASQATSAYLVRGVLPAAGRVCAR